jgi:hypothetical protein
MNSETRAKSREQRAKDIRLFALIPTLYAYVLPVRITALTSESEEAILFLFPGPNQEHSR